MTILIALFVLVAQTGSDTVTQAQLDKMSDACKAPRRWLRSLGDNQVRFRPNPRAKYRTVDCVLTQMKKSNLPMKLGFVGNEAASGTEK